MGMPLSNLEMLKAMLPLIGDLKYRVFISTMKGEEGQWLFIAVKMPEEEENDTPET